MQRLKDVADDGRAKDGWKAAHWQGEPDIYVVGRKQNHRHARCWAHGHWPISLNLPVLCSKYTCSHRYEPVTMLLTTTTMIASTSRIAPTPMVTSISRRTVVHHARPPRRPILNPPHSPKLPLPTSGTSQPHPPKLAASTPSTSSQSSPKTRSTILEGTNLTLHHSPPPSAPSYTTGSVPPFLQWLGGESVHLTGEEVAPRRKERKPEMEGGLGWTDGMIEQMREMRKKGLSRKAIAEG